MNHDINQDLINTIVNQSIVSRNDEDVDEVTTSSSAAIATVASAATTAAAASTAELEIFSCDLPLRKPNDNNDATGSIYSCNKTILKEGILFKQREVFKREWRPRWFILDPQAGILSYYLFSSKESIKKKKMKKSSSKNLSSSQHPIEVVLPKERKESLSPYIVEVIKERKNEDGYSNNNDKNNETIEAPSSQQETSPSRRVGASVNYDAIPRGSIHLTNRCKVEMDDGLSRPDEDIFVFRIIPPSSSSDDVFCLAATTETSRVEWIEAIIRVCSEKEEIIEEGGEQLTNKEIYINDKSNSKTEVSQKRRKSKTRQEKMALTDEGKSIGTAFSRGTSFASSIEGYSDEVEEEEELHQVDEVSLWLLSLILLTPLFIYNFIDIAFDDDGNIGFMLLSKEMAFLLSAFMAIRTTTLLKLGISVPVVVDNSETGIIRSTSYSFNFDFKNIQNSKNNYGKEQEDQEQQQQKQKKGKKKTAEKKGIDDNEDEVLMNLSRLVKAVGIALSEMDVMTCENIRIPILGINGHFLSSFRKSDISILCLRDGDRNEEDSLITIPNVIDLELDEVFGKLLSTRKKPQEDAYLSTTPLDQNSSLLSELFPKGGGNNNHGGSCLIIMNTKIKNNNGDNKNKQNSSIMEEAIQITPGLYNVVITVGISAHQEGKIFKKKNTTKRGTVIIQIDCPTSDRKDSQQFSKLIQEELLALLEKDT